MTGATTVRRPPDASVPSLARSAVEAALIGLVCAAVGLVVNGIRPTGLPLVAAEPYQTLVPCPEPGGPVEAVEAGDPVVAGPRTFLVDARSPEAFARSHLPGAVNLPYDWLDPVPESRLHELATAIASSRSTTVVVYGDGGRPDSGEHLGREISGRGIKNVHFVAGGAPALLTGEEP
jgi:rhodanese-related sulfurtransferase